MSDKLSEMAEQWLGEQSCISYGDERAYEICECDLTTLLRTVRNEAMEEAAVIGDGLPDNSGIYVAKIIRTLKATPWKDGDGCVYDGKLYIRRADGKVDVRSTKLNDGLWKECKTVPIVVLRLLFPEVHEP